MEEMDLEKTTLSQMEADLFLIHAPSVYDFRERDDILFAFLSDSDSVNITSIYEMYPLGFLSIKQWLKSKGYRVDMINAASLMLMYPGLSVEGLISKLSAPVFGLDLHWLAQGHGAIEVAKLIKKIHPHALTLFGGISATYYADELIQYPSVDVIIQGYDTLKPLAKFMKNVTNGERDFARIPNLLYKNPAGEIVRTGFSHKPQKNYNDISIDWSFYRPLVKDIKMSKSIMTLPNSGCAMDCSWCGGSRYTFRNIMGTQHSLVFKDHSKVMDELASIGEDANMTTIYALQCYSEPKQRLIEYLDWVAESGYKSISLELFHLPDQELLAYIGRSPRAYIMLSPESHDKEISRLAGRGNFSMEEMEAWIPKAFDAGVKGVMVWFFIGMPKQTCESVLATVDYCEHLIKKFSRHNVIPLICPLVPFLDPGSRIFESPESFGYRLFYITLEQHRQALVQPLWYKRLNYESNWMSRHEIQDVTYEAVARLVRIKGEYGIFPAQLSNLIIDTINETLDIINQMERGLALDGKIPESLKGAVKSYNRKVLSYSTSQLVPYQLPFGTRWFDDYTVPASMIEELVC